MQLTRRSAVASVVGAIGVGRLVSAHDMAMDSTPDSATDHDHMDATPAADTGSGAAFMEITNTGETDDTLLSGETNVARSVEIHAMEMDGDVMRMKELKDGLVIPAGETVALESGGYHVMLINLEQDLLEGDEFELRLTFESAGEVVVSVVVASEAPDNDPVIAGNLEISGAFARPAPMLGGHNHEMATPDATPHSGH